MEINVAPNTITIIISGGIEPPLISQVEFLPIGNMALTHQEKISYLRSACIVALESTAWAYVEKIAQKSAVSL